MQTRASLPFVYLRSEAGFGRIKKFLTFLDPVSKMYEWLVRQFRSIVITYTVPVACKFLGYVFVVYILFQPILRFKMEILIYFFALNNFYIYW